MTDETDDSKKGKKENGLKKRKRKIILAKSLDERRERDTCPGANVHVATAFYSFLVLRISSAYISRETMNTNKNKRKPIEQLQRRAQRFKLSCTRLD